jgi:hypothetical protein
MTLIDDLLGMKGYLTESPTKRNTFPTDYSLALNKSWYWHQNNDNALLSHSSAPKSFRTREMQRPTCACLVQFRPALRKQTAVLNFSPANNPLNP